MNVTRITIVSALCALCTVTSNAQAQAQAQAQPSPLPRYALDGARLDFFDGPTETTVDLGCIGTQALPIGTTVFVACGARGVAVTDLRTTPPTVSRVPTNAPVRALRFVEGTVFADLGDEQLVIARANPQAASDAPTRVDSMTPQAAPEPEPASPPSAGSSYDTDDTPAEPPSHYTSRGEIEPPPPPPIGRITRVQDSEAIVEFIGDNHLEVGHEVEVLRRRRAPNLALDGERGELELVARGRVMALDGPNMRVRLEVNGDAQPGLLVRTRYERAGVSFAPPAVTGITSLAIHARGFVPMGILGIGTLTDMSIRHTTDFGLVLGAETAPLGLGASKVGGVEGILAYGFAGLSLPMFGVDVGAGWSTANVPSNGRQRSGGFSVMQRLRLGNPDGLMLRVRATLVVWEDEWIVGDVYADGQIPIGHGYWLTLNGGGGTSGIRMGEVGLRILAAGTGRANSVYVTVSAGAALLDRGRRNDEPADAQYFANGGPMAGVGAEWRL